MSPFFIFLFSIICLQTSLCNASLYHFIDGSFSDSWSLNFTVFMNDFRNTILYCVDFERNNVILSVTKKEVSTVTIRYNAQSYKESMQSLCGCDPCDEMLVNFYINSWPGAIMLGCNNRGTITGQRFDTRYRINPDVPSEVTHILNQRNRIYALMLIDTVGCLHSFHFNNAPITFPTNGNIFLPNCPGRCTLGLCNNGKCRALSATGPICDCSSTACNGQYCNQSLRSYHPGHIHTYEITDGSDNVNFKLSWKAMAEKKYCLFELVHEHGHVTLSIFQKYLLRGSDVISEIVPDDVNFIAVSIRDNDLVIKVNNKLANIRLVLFGNIQIKVGFTGKEEKCTVFEGKYDVVLNFTELYKVRRTAASSFNSTIAWKIDQMNGNSIPIIAGSLVVIVIVISALIIAVVFILRNYRPRRSIVDENIYDNNIPRKVQFVLNVASKRDSNSLYDSIRESQLYVTPRDMQSCDLPRVPTI